MTGKMANSNKKKRVCDAHTSAAKRLNTFASETLYRAALSLFLSVVAMFRRFSLPSVRNTLGHCVAASRAFAQQSASAPSKQRNRPRSIDTGNVLLYFSRCHTHRSRPRQFSRRRDSHSGRLPRRKRERATRRAK